MGEVIELFPAEGAQGGPDGRRIRAFVEGQIDFELCDSVYEQVDHVVGELWNDLPVGGHLDADQIKEALRGLQTDGVLLGETHRKALAVAFVEALAADGHVVPCD